VCGGEISNEPWGATSLKFEKGSQQSRGSMTIGSIPLKRGEEQRATAGRWTAWPQFTPELLQRTVASRVGRSRFFRMHGGNEEREGRRRLHACGRSGRQCENREVAMVERHREQHGGGEQPLGEVKGEGREVEQHDSGEQPGVQVFV